MKKLDRKQLDRILCEEVNVKEAHYLIAETDKGKLYLVYNYDRDIYELELNKKRIKNILEKLLWKK